MVSATAKKKSFVWASCDLHISWECTTVEEWTTTTSTAITTITTPDCSHQSHLFLTQLAFFLVLARRLGDKEWPRWLSQIRPFSSFHNTREKKDKRLYSSLLRFSPLLRNSTHSLSQQKVWLGDICASCFKKKLPNQEEFFLLTSQSFGICTQPASLWGIKSLQESTLTAVWLLWRWFFCELCLWLEVDWAIMAGKGNQVPGPHLNGFPVPTYSYFFPHMLGSLSPPALPGLPISGYSTPSPASK